MYTATHTAYINNDQHRIRVDWGETVNKRIFAYMQNNGLSCANRAGFGVFHDCKQEIILLLSESALDKVMNKC